MMDNISLEGQYLRKGMRCDRLQRNSLVPAGVTKCGAHVARGREPLERTVETASPEG
jgi:hypothetical protein